MSVMMFITLACLILVIFAIFLAIKPLVFKKRLTVMRSDQFVYEFNGEKIKKNRILLIFENGYWEIKEEIRRKEWSPNGSMEIIDFDSNINDKRYKEFTGEFPLRDKEGRCALKLVKEIELHPLLNPDELQNVRI